MYIQNRDLNGHRPKNLETVAVNMYIQNPVADC